MDYKEQYITRMWETIKDVDIKGSFPSVIIAQGAVESDWGRSSLATRYNNYFGIKAGSNWTGKTVNMQTGEVFDGVNVSISSNFRVYPSIIASLKDRIALLAKYYPAALAATTPDEEVQALKNGGYATALNYTTSIVNIINTNDLTQFDNKIKYIMKASTTYSIFLALGIITAGLSLYKLINN